MSRLVIRIIWLWNVVDQLDLVVAGGGIAGLTAGLTAARLGRTTLILTGHMPGGNLLSIDCIEGYPGYPDGIPGYELCPAVQEQAAAAGAAFAMTEATGLQADGDGWRVSTIEGDHAARAVIVATGTSLKELGVPGEERLRGKGVSHCASCDAPLLRGRPVVVIGGGDSALQEALTLAATASRVTILTLGDKLTAQAAFRARVAAHPIMEIRCNVRVREILGGDGVTGVRIEDTASGKSEDVEADGVFIYIGMAPNMAVSDEVPALDATGRVMVDMHMRTGLPGIFAAGTVRSGSPGRAAASAGDGALAAIAANDFLTGGD
jgi:thioredoxin reductase (NADPH)